jgi:Tol biopolymer transport system component
MRNKLLRLSLAFGLLAPVGAFAYSVDRELRLPINYFTLVPPAVGQSYLDPVFGTAIRRISDTRNQPNSGDTGNLAFIVNEYSTMSPFNQDGSRLILVHQSYFALYDGEGRYQKDLPFDISASTEPRWSRRDPNLLYYVSANSLMSYDVATGVRTVVRTFAEYAKVDGRGESDICFDGDHFVLVGDARDIFVYELSTGTKGPVLDATGHPFDSVYIAPGDQVIVSWYQTGSARYAGMELFDRNMGFLRQLASVNGHKDVGRDIDGQAVLFWMNAADPQAPADCQNGVVKIRLADAQRTCVLSLGWGVAGHVSAPDDGGWFFVSTYAPGDPLPVPGQWRPYMAEVLQVRADGSEVRRLAHDRSRPLNDYWYTPRAAVSRDGRRLVYSSNYGLPSILGYDRNYSDVYLVDVASSAPAYPGSATSLSTRYEQDHPSVSLAGGWYANGYSLHSGGSAVLGIDPAARATFSFTGTGVRWIGYRDPWSGIGRVSLDGQPASLVDTYSLLPQVQTVLYSASGLAPGSHTLDVMPSGTRSSLSAGYWIWVDAFEVTARAQEDDSAVNYGGTWTPAALPLFSGGRAVMASDTGAQASFRFSGPAVSWIGYRDGTCGIARVLVDGNLRTEIDTYAAAAQAQTVVYTLSGLLPGEHVLTLEVTGRRHPLSVGNAVWVDGFDILPQ